MIYLAEFGCLKNFKVVDTISLFSEVGVDALTDHACVQHLVFSIGVRSVINYNDKVGKRKTARARYVVKS